MKSIGEKQTKRNKMIKAILVILIPITILAFVYYGLEITPFGDNSLLTIDLKNQYISYFSYLKSSLQGQDSLLYSFSKTLSGNMLGLVGYYLISPFNILFLFADVASFTTVLTIVTLLKTGTAALTMYVYLKSKKIEGIPLYILPTAYALSSYMISYQQNIMWLDAVILLPLVVLGIDKLIDKKQPYVYIFSLAFLIMTNYYIGFMVCIFSVIYFLISALKYLNDGKRTLKEIGSLSLKFVFSSLIAGGISSIIWLPAILSYSGSSKVAFDISELLDMNKNFDLIDFISKFIIGSTNANQIRSGLPNIFIPSSLLILGILFFMNSKIRVSQKVKYGLLIIIMYASFKFVGLNKIWHGFSEPSWFPYRNSFIFIFLIICIIAIQMKKFSISLIQLISILIIVLFTLFHIHNSNFEYITAENIKITFAVSMLSLIVISLAINKKIKLEYIFISLLMLTIFETTYNSYSILETNQYYNASQYEEFVTDTKPVVEEYQPQDNEFYRLEKTFFYNENDPLLLNYPGLSHYSSNELDSVKEFLGSMGYRNNGNWSIYSNGSSLFSDSLLGIKYVISDDNPKNYLNLVQETEKFNIYQNPYAFPLGFLTKGSLKTETIENNNTFQYQNELMNMFFGVDNVYQEVPRENIEITTINLEYSKEDSEHIFTKDNPEKEAYLTFDISGFETNDQLNIFFMNDSLNNSGEIYFDGEYYGKILASKENNIYTYNPQSEQVQINIKLTDDQIAFNQSLLYFNEIGQIKDMYSFAEANKLKITSFSPNNIQGEIPSKQSDSHLTMSIPYDDSWTVSIDGKKANTFRVNDVLLGVEIPRNSEYIELEFIPKGLRVSIIIFIVSSGICIYNFSKNRKKI